MREHLRTHPPRLLAGASAVPEATDIEPEHGEFVFGLACACGGDGFRVLGVPATMAGGTRGYVLRSVLRVWRELRATAAGDDGMTGRLGPPLALDCTRCGARLQLLADDGDAQAPPLEALRCRPCRRSTFGVAALCAHRDADLDAEARGGEEECYDAWRLAVRCRACGTVGEPFAHTLRGEQERRIDRLYGRDGRSA